MDTPKRIGLISNGLGGWRLWSKDEPNTGGRDHPDAEYILAAEHDQIVAEKDAEIEALQALVLELKRKRDTWHADANLMLGFADLAYEAGVVPTSKELISAKHRAVSSIRNDALEDAAMKATGFLVGNPEHGSPLRNPMPHEIAAAIRAMKGWKE